MHVADVAAERIGAQVTREHAMPKHNSSKLPFVSVVAPALNCRDDIDPFLAALGNQDYPRDLFEVIVADNGSTDGTREYLEKTWARSCFCPERGRARALNAGLALARGEIICTTDLSCLAEPHWISAIVKAFEEPNVGCVAGDIRLLRREAGNRIIEFQDRTDYMSPMRAISRQTFPYMPFADGANASFRRALFNEIGGFEDTFIKAADVEICYRMFALTDYKIVFDYQASMQEPGEPTLWALLHQRYRMGIGWNLLRTKYPLLFARRSRFTVREFYWSLREGVTEIGHLVAANARALFGQGRNDAYDATIQFLMSWAQSLGRIYGHWHLARRGIEPMPIDARSQQRLIDSEGVGDRVVVRGADQTLPTKLLVTNHARAPSEARF